MRLYKIWWLVPLLLLCACSPGAGEPVLETGADMPEPTADAIVYDTVASARPAADDLQTEEPAAPEERDIPPELTEPVEIDYQAVKPNEVGNIMIIMYHGLSENNPPYDRKTADFINDLKTLYDNGFRLISMNDLIDGNIHVEAGCTPVVLTFDDGKSTAFSLMEQDGVFQPTPGCAVDIINRFCDAHPDFGKAAIFYVNGRKDAFAGSGTLADRFTYLLNNGYEIGNHTFSHADLGRLNATQIQEELGRMDAIIKENTAGYAPRSMTYPNGVRPKENLRKYIQEGEYDGNAYAYVWGIREGQSTITGNPFNSAFDPLNVPRVRASDDSNPDYNVQDLGYFLRYYINHPEQRYISDGNPDRLSVPESRSHLVNADALGERALYIYTVETEE